MNLIRTRRAYALAAAGTALFSAVYESFSHGVLSDRMIFAFLIPLLCGYVPFALMKKIAWRYRPGAVSSRLYHSALALFTAGCVFGGVMEIYGSTSRYVGVYLVCGAVFLAAAFVAYWAERVRYLRICGSL